MPVVVNRKTVVRADFDADAKWVSIGRPSRYGNPFVIGKHGTRDEVVEKYRHWLWSQIQYGIISVADLKALGGADFLVCYCAPLPCHGDVLLRAIEWANSQPA
jgi:hypothetical protein